MLEDRFLFINVVEIVFVVNGKTYWSEANRTHEFGKKWIFFKFIGYCGKMVGPNKHVEASIDVAAKTNQFNERGFEKARDKASACGDASSAAIFADLYRVGRRERASRWGCRRSRAFCDVHRGLCGSA